jgi:hypothetical protein
MVLKVAAREALSQPPASGDQDVEVGFPGGRSWGGAGGAAGTPYEGAVRRAGAEGREAFGVWPGHMVIVRIGTHTLIRGWEWY